MEKKLEQNESQEDYIEELQDNCPPSDKVLNRLALSCAILSATLVAGIGIVALIVPDVATQLWLYMLFPIIIIWLVGIAVSVAQLARNPHKICIIALIISIATFLSIILFIVIKALVSHKIFVPIINGSKRLF